MKQRFILMILFIAFFTVSTVEAQNKALNNACVYFASLAGSTLKGRIVADMSVNQVSELGKCCERESGSPAIWYQNQ